MKSYKTPDEADLAFFHTVLPPARILADEEHIHRCAQDHTEDLHHPPDVVLQPETTEEISAIMRYCNEQRIAVTPRGAGTGLSGGALAVHGGVSLDMRRMARILNIDTKNFQVTTEPGVITQQLQDAVREKGLFIRLTLPLKALALLVAMWLKTAGGQRL